MLLGLFVVTLALATPAMPAAACHEAPVMTMAHGAMRVTRTELGYAYRIPVSNLAELALGGSGFMLFKPAKLDNAYGRLPTGFSLFAKLSLGH